MNRSDQLRQQIDACRGGSDDLSLPELAELRAAAENDGAVSEELARVQQFDRAVAAALADAPLPDGLLDRLLAATKAADVVQQAAAQEPPPAASVIANPARPPRHISRRLAWISAGSAAAVLLVAVAAVQFWPRSLRMAGQGELNQSVDRWLSDVQAAKTWNPVASAPMPSAYAIPPSVVAQPQRWTRFRAAGSGWSASGVAIDLAPPMSPPAVLFVVAPTARFPVAPTPYTRLSLTGATKAAAWQSPTTNMLYVLVVVEDGRQRLDQFLRAPRTI